MNPDFSKLQLAQHQTEQTDSKLEATAGQERACEFASVEEMIRTDQDQIEVPPVIAERLNQSIAREPKPKTPWWKRMFREEK